MVMVGKREREEETQLSCARLHACLWRFAAAGLPTRCKSPSRFRSPRMDPGSLGSFDSSGSSSNITVGLASAQIRFELSQHRSGNASKLNAFLIDGVCDSRANYPVQRLMSSLRALLDSV